MRPLNWDTALVGSLTESLMLRYTICHHLFPWELGGAETDTHSHILSDFRRPRLSCTTSSQSQSSWTGTSEPSRRRRPAAAEDSEDHLGSAGGRHCPHHPVLPCLYIPFPMTHCVNPYCPTYKQHPTHRVYYTQTGCTHLLMYTNHTFFIKYKSPSPKNTLRKHYGIYLLMLITSQSLHTFVIVVVWDKSHFLFHVIAAFTPSFGSNCFYLDT